MPARQAGTLQPLAETWERTVALKKNLEYGSGFMKLDSIAYAATSRLEGREGEPCEVPGNRERFAAETTKHLIASLSDLPDVSEEFQQAVNLSLPDIQEHVEQMIRTMVRDGLFCEQGHDARRLIAAMVMDEVGMRLGL